MTPEINLDLSDFDIKYTRPKQEDEIRDTLWDYLTQVYLKQQEKIEFFELSIEDTIHKPFYTTLDLEILYDLSKAQQKELRGKISDPLPYYKLQGGRKIYHKPEEIQEWFDRNLEFKL